MSVQIIQAEPADLDEVRALLVEYVATLPGGQQGTPGFDQELATLPGAYGLPHGRLLLARVEDAAAGCVALRPQGPEACEMKRLYVRPAFRAHGLGRQLVAALVEEARRAGHGRMRLDTLPTMTAALALYRAFGFRPAPAYLERHAAEAVCFEVVL
jgi:putative acetyltransferase